MTTTQPVIRSLTSLITLLAGLGCACSKKAENKEEAPAPTPVASDEAQAAQPAKPTSDKLTAEAIMAAENVAEPLGQWATGLAAMQEHLGEPTAVHENVYSWATQAGDSCTYVYVTRDNEADNFPKKPDPKDTVGAISKPLTVKADLPGNWAECLKAAGLNEPTNAVDPAAPLPPKAGATSVQAMRAGIAGAKSRWVGKSLTVEGVFQSVSTSTATGSDVQTVTMSIGNTADGGETIACTLISGATAPEIAPGTAIKVAGQITASFGGGLDDCAMLAQ